MSRRALQGSGVARIVAAALAAAIAAEIAVIVLSPGEDLPDPVGVDPATYFSSAELEHAADYAGDQRRLLVIGLVVELAALGLVASGRPRRLRRVLERAGRRPLLGAAAVGIGLSVGLAVLALPTGALGHDRAVEVGLSTQSTGAWLADQARSAAIAGVIAAIGAMLLVGLQRRLPRGWWLAGSGVVLAFAVLMSWIAPVLLAPIFNRFEPLADGPVRSEVLRLADEAGVDVGQVYRVDASRRTTALNAYVDGIGPTKRVVLYDTLLRSSERPALRSVVAHELAHVAHADIRRGLLFVAIVAPFGMLFVREAGGRLAARGGAALGTPAALAAYVLAISVASFGLNLAGNQLSRKIESSADAFALELTNDPRGFVELQRDLARTNLSDPDPPGWSQALFGSHPTTEERIGAALAYEREDDG